MRKLAFCLAIAVMIVLLPLSSSAKDNSISIFGSYMPTYLGLEYERRLGDWGIGAEFGLLPIDQWGGRVRFGLLGRYYLNLDSPVTPYFTLAPGLIMQWYNMIPELSSTPSIIPDTDYFFGFLGYATAGVEYRVSIIRTAIELGGGFMTAPAPASVVQGFFVVKGGIGVTF